MADPGAKKFFYIYFPPILIYLVIFTLSSLPASALPSDIPDIVPHFFEYLVFSYFSIRILRGDTGFKKLLSVGLLVLFLAFLDEVHQYFVPTRFFSLKDLLVDFIGIGAGMVIYVVVNRRIPSTDRPSPR